MLSHAATALALGAQPTQIGERNNTALAFFFLIVLITLASPVVPLGWYGKNSSGLSATA